MKKRLSLEEFEDIKEILTKENGQLLISGKAFVQYTRFCRMLPQIVRDGARNLTKTKVFVHEKTKVYKNFILKLEHIWNKDGHGCVVLIPKSNYDFYMETRDRRRWGW